MSDDRRRKRLYIKLRYLCESAHLDREDRLELARYMFRHDDYGYIESFSDLETDDLEKLAFAVESWKVIQELRLMNGSLETESQIVMKRLSETAEEAAERQNDTGSWD